MNKLHSIALIGLRLSIGFLFLYSGVSHIMDPNWSAAGYLGSAKLMTGFYSWLSSPVILPITNALNAWGMALIGASLVTGVAVRYSAMFGALMMLLYRIPLGLLRPNAHAFIVDEHVIYIFALLLIASHAKHLIPFKK